jgi:hypothetical protein
LLFANDLCREPAAALLKHLVDKSTGMDTSNHSEQKTCLIRANSCSFVDRLSSSLIFSFSWGAMARSLTEWVGRFGLSMAASTAAASRGRRRNQDRRRLTKIKKREI